MHCIKISSLNSNPFGHRKFFFVAVMRSVRIMFTSVNTFLILLVRRTVLQESGPLSQRPKTNFLRMGPNFFCIELDPLTILCCNISSLGGFLLIQQWCQSCLLHDFPKKSQKWWYFFKKKIFAQIIISCQ